MTTLEAIEAGIQKWEEIRDGKIGITRGTSLCKLCTMFMDRRLDHAICEKFQPSACKACPLSKVNHCCLRPSSTWMKYADLLEEEPDEMQIISKTVKSKELTALADKMISHLKEAATNYTETPEE